MIADRRLPLSVTTRSAMTGGSGRCHADDAYHRFVRDGAWSMSTLWRQLAVHAVDRFAATGVIEVLCDDTVHHKSGRRVDGAGVFRDAVRTRHPSALPRLAAAQHRHARHHDPTSGLRAHDVLWYRVNNSELARLVIVRDPDGVQSDDHFFTTDRAATGAEVTTRYAGRWPIEVCFRDVKRPRRPGPQSWKRRGPEHAAALSLWLHVAIWCW